MHSYTVIHQDSGKAGWQQFWGQIYRAWSLDVKKTQSPWGSAASWPLYEVTYKYLSHLQPRCPGRSLDFLPIGREGVHGGVLSAACCAHPNLIMSSRFWFVEHKCPTSLRLLPFVSEGSHRNLTSGLGRSPRGNSNNESLTTYIDSMHTRISWLPWGLMGVVFFRVPLPEILLHPSS